jgi:hypothetical protein
MCIEEIEYLPELEINNGGKYRILVVDCASNRPVDILWYSDRRTTKQSWKWYLAGLFRVYRHSRGSIVVGINGR